MGGCISTLSCVIHANETNQHYARIEHSHNSSLSPTCLLVVRAVGVVEVRYGGPYCNIYPDYPARQYHQGCDAIRTWDCFECGAAGAPCSVDGLRDPVGKMVARQNWASRRSGVRDGLEVHDFSKVESSRTNIPLVSFLQSFSTA